MVVGVICDFSLFFEAHRLVMATQLPKLCPSCDDWAELVNRDLMFSWDRVSLNALTPQNTVLDL